MQKENDLIQRKDGTPDVYRIIGFVHKLVLLMPFDVKAQRDKKDAPYITTERTTLKDFETLSLNAHQICEDGEPWDHDNHCAKSVYMVMTCRNEWKAPAACAIRVHACTTETEAISKLYWLYKNVPNFTPSDVRTLMRNEVPSHTIAMEM